MYLLVSQVVQLFPDFHFQIIWNFNTFKSELFSTLVKKGYYPLNVYLSNDSLCSK